LQLPSAHGETPGTIRHAGPWRKLAGPNRQLLMLLGLVYQVVHRSSNRVGTTAVATVVVVAVVIVVRLVVLVLLVVVLVVATPAPPATSTASSATFWNFLLIEGLVKLYIKNARRSYSLLYCKDKDNA